MFRHSDNLFLGQVNSQEEIIDFVKLKLNSNIYNTLRENEFVFVLVDKDQAGKHQIYDLSVIIVHIPDGANIISLGTLQKDEIVGLANDVLNENKNSIIYH